LPPPPSSPLFPYTTLFRSVALLLLALHRAARVVVDDPALALGGGSEEGLLDYLGQRGGPALDGAGERIAAEGAEPHAAQLGLLRSEEHTSELQSRENLVCR